MSDDGPDVHNVFDGRAEISLQAGSVHGGVHVHAGRLREAPRLVPVPTPHFLNQRRVLAEADAVFELDVDRLRILVFTGSPGGGKREVARYWLHHHSGDFPDGQFHADLSAGADVDGLVSGKLREFLLAAGIDSSAIPDSVDGRAACFRSWSTGKRVAVVVDHALTPSQVRMVRPGPGRSVVLVTTAQDLDALRVRDLTTFIDLSPLENDFAVDLLGRLAGQERVAAVPAAAQELVDMCAGLPIALCVVGGLLSTRRSRRPGGVAREAGELRDERARLSGMSAGADLSVDPVFNTAYQRLSPVAQRCHRVLGVHPGAGARSDEVLHAMLAGDEPAAVAAAVDELVAAGLVHEEPDGERYRQHPLLGLHAVGLASEEEKSETLARIVDHYVPRAMRAGHSVIPGRGWLGAFFGEVPGEPMTSGEAMRWLRAERENLRALIDPLLACGRTDDLHKLAIALWPLHERDKHLADLVAFNEAAITTERHGERSGLGALHRIQLAFAHLHRGDPGAARGLCETAVASARIPTLEATAVETLGLVLLALGELGGAEDLLRRSLAMATSIGDVRRLAIARFHLAKVCPPAEASPMLEDALAAFTDPAVSDQHNAAKTRWWLGRRLTDLGRVAAARAQLDEALAFMRAERMVYDQARILESLGDLAMVVGDLATAARRFRESVVITESCGFLPDSARVRRKLDPFDGDDVGAGPDGE